jgi:hypothetical protein
VNIELSMGTKGNDGRNRVLGLSFNFRFLCANPNPNPEAVVPAGDCIPVACLRVLRLRMDDYAAAAWTVTLQ